jgi:hypothetical protein
VAGGIAIEMNERERASILPVRKSRFAKSKNDDKLNALQKIIFHHLSGNSAELGDELPLQTKGSFAVHKGKSGKKWG